MALMIAAIELNSRLWAIISADNTASEHSEHRPARHNLIYRVNWGFVTKF